MDNCVFCKIVSQDIPSYKVYEDEEVLAFLDLSQVTPGHTLLIPKTHKDDIFAYDAELAATVFSRVPKIAQAMEKAFPEMAGLNIVNNNKELGYQTVFHSHIHLIPRYTSADGFELIFKENTKNYGPDELATLAEKISEQVTN